MKTRAQADVSRRLHFLPLAVAFAMIVQGGVTAEERYERYYNELPQHPDMQFTSWAEGAEGIAHDSNCWFITQAHDQNSILWKIPVGADLATVDANSPGVLTKQYNQIGALIGAGLWHFGDLDYREYGDKRYVFVGVSNWDCIPPNISPPGVAVFDADTLDLIDYCHWPYSLTCDNNTEWAWCAFDAQGFLCGAHQVGSSMHRAVVDWDVLYNALVLVLTPTNELVIVDQDGAPANISWWIQGGKFTPSGDMLYLSTGAGIAVFDCSSRTNAVFVKLSCNGDKTECFPEHFVFQFDPDWPVSQEPEGLAIWDVDDMNAPGIKGQLHVLLLDNEVGDDNVWIWNYTQTLYVDRASISGDGTPQYPYPTVTGAAVNAWAGCQLKIKGGSYPESVTFSNKMQVLSWGGNTVTIGQ